jgi:hypothetical protein
MAAAPLRRLRASRTISSPVRFSLASSKSAKALRTCPCGGTVRAVVIYELNKQGVRVSPKREIEHGCDSCDDHKLIDMRDVWPDQAPQGALF